MDEVFSSQIGNRQVRVVGVNLLVILFPSNSLSNHNNGFDGHGDEQEEPSAIEPTPELQRSCCSICI